MLLLECQYHAAAVQKVHRLMLLEGRPNHCCLDAQLIHHLIAKETRQLETHLSPLAQLLLQLPRWYT